jgi:hypothetical protein
MEGYEVTTVGDRVERCNIFVTTTGCKDIVTTTGCKDIATTTNPGQPDRSRCVSNANHAPTSDCCTASGALLTLSYYGKHATSSQDGTTAAAAGTSPSATAPSATNALGYSALGYDGKHALGYNALGHTCTGVPFTTTTNPGQPDRSRCVSNANHAPTSDCCTASGALLTLSYYGKHATSSQDGTTATPPSQPGPGGGKGGEGEIEKRQRAALRTNTWPGGPTVNPSPGGHLVSAQLTSRGPGALAGHTAPVLRSVRTCPRPLGLRPLGLWPHGPQYIM